MFNFSTTKNENEYYLGGNLAAHMLQSPHAAVAELVDALALGASAFGREGSSPFCRTRI